MLRMADSEFEPALEQDIFSNSSTYAPQAPVSSSFYVTSERYAASNNGRLPTIGLIVALHAVALFGLMQVRQYVQHRKDASLSVVNLTPAAPPPPAEATPPPPPSQPQVVSPPPIVQVPKAPPTIATSPEPVPASPLPAVMVDVPPTRVAPTAAPMAALPALLQMSDIGSQMVSGKPPRYPIESRRKREQGTVVLSVIVGTNGAVESINIAQTSGFARLDDAAKDAVKTWRWKPIMQNGVPARVKGVVDIPFILQG